MDKIHLFQQMLPLNFWFLVPRAETTPWIQWDVSTNGPFFNLRVNVVCLMNRVGLMVQGRMFSDSDYYEIGVRDWKLNEEIENQKLEILMFLIPCLKLRLTPIISYLTLKGYIIIRDAKENSNLIKINSIFFF